MIRVLIIAAILLAPAACGRKGDLVSPSQAQTR
ncbi:hypothetical protein SAMN06273572_10382 [Monaibacterium marinum]|uniref:Lipoprotein-attachment site-containing protein n=1 Tax=Pontivivens marinum TaxID=1690039 RepID=A0A2C9CSB7_9RHOB|nr:lipoprotein [Monaibacterium marinum]SOH94055.1 hypothetical protein SAMN06273572_10382 [Monaibacterium marinum]